MGEEAFQARVVKKEKTDEELLREQNRERWQLLSEIIGLYEGQLRQFSRNEAMLTAKPGYEAAFDAHRHKLDVLREMLREYRWNM